MSFEELVGGSVDDDFIDEVTTFDRVDDILPFCHFAEDGVLAIEMRSRAVSDEELRAVGVRAGVGHGEDAGLVVATVCFALALELVAGAASTAARWAAALDHEVWNDAVKFQAIVKSS